MKECTMIINPNSGRHSNKFDIEKIKKIFLKHDYIVDVIMTSYQGHAREIVTSLDTDLVISVGGDGTFNEVMSGNFKRKDKLLVSHIPLGTANDIGAMYGYGKNFYKNLNKLLNGKIKQIDVCTINDRPFTYVAALGKFTNISYDTPRHLKKKFGYLAYLIEGLKNLPKSPILYNVKYKVNGLEQDGKYSFLLISNANRIAGINNFYENIKLDDNCFEVLLCEHTNEKQVLKSLYRLKDGDISTCQGFKFYRTNHIEFEFDRNLTKGWSIDGEELMDKNAKFTIDIVKNVNVLIPKKNIKKLFLNKE